MNIKYFHSFFKSNQARSRNRYEIRICWRRYTDCIRLTSSNLPHWSLKVHPENTKILKNKEVSYRFFRPTFWTSSLTKKYRRGFWPLHGLGISMKPCPPSLPSMQSTVSSDVREWDAILLMETRNWILNLAKKQEKPSILQEDLALIHRHVTVHLR